MKEDVRCTYPAARAIGVAGCAYSLALSRS